MNALKTIHKIIKENNSVVSIADAAREGVSRSTLARLAKGGKLERVAHGYYILANGDIPDELYMLRLRSEKVIFSHETALFLHDMAERTPLQYSFSVPNNYKLSPSFPRDCKVYYVKPELHELGQCSIQTKMSHEVVAYNMERTICDILRSRSRIDSQTFAAALKNYATTKEKNWDKLREYADTFHVSKLLRQYLEVLL